MAVQSQRLGRSGSDRMLAGVCGGLATYFELDATVVRLVWAGVTAFTAVIPGVFVYLLFVVIVPVGEGGEATGGNPSELFESRAAPAGMLLLLLGALFLLSNFGIFDWLSWGRLWPLLLILLGVALLVRRR